MADNSNRKPTPEELKRIEEFNNSPPANIPSSNNYSNYSGYSNRPPTAEELRRINEFNSGGSTNIYTEERPDFSNYVKPEYTPKLKPETINIPAIPEIPDSYWAKPENIIKEYNNYRANPDLLEPEYGPDRKDISMAYDYLAQKNRGKPQTEWEPITVRDPLWQTVLSKWSDPTKPQTPEDQAIVDYTNEILTPPEPVGTWEELSPVGKIAKSLVGTGSRLEGEPGFTKITGAIIPAVGSFAPGYLGGLAVGAGLAAAGAVAAPAIGTIALVGGIGTALLQGINYITGKDNPILNKVGNWLDVFSQSGEKAFVGVPAVIKSTHPEIDKNTEWGYTNPNLEARGYEKKPSYLGDAVDNFLDLAVEVVKMPFGKSDITKEELETAWQVGAIGLEQNPFIANTALNIMNRIGGYETADYGEYYRYELGTNEPQAPTIPPDELNRALVQAVNVYNGLINPNTNKPYTSREIEDDILLRAATNQYGISGAINDIVGQEILDITNYLPPLTGMFGTVVGKATGNQNLVKAAEINRGEAVADIAPFPLNALSGKQKTGGLNELSEIHKKVLRGELGENPVKVDTLSDLERMIAGVTPEGKYRELQPTQPSQRTGIIGKIENAVQNLASLTPVSKADLLSNQVLNMINAISLMSDTPETMLTNMAKMADLIEVSPDDSINKIYGTAEQRTSSEALKAIVSSKQFEAITSQWNATESMRNSLNLLADQVGKKPAEIIQGIIQNPQAIKQLIQDTAAKNNGSIMGQMLTDDGTLLIDQFQVFTDKKNPLPYTLEQVTTEYSKVAADMLSDYVTQLYDVKPDNLAIRLSDMMKKFQSIFLLGFSPSYLANNYVNNIVTRAAVGVFGFPNVDKWTDRFGIIPVRMNDSMAEFRGANSTDTGVYATINQKLKNAKRKGDVVDKAGDLLSSVGSQTPIMKLNGKIESVESARANVVGQMQYMAKAWRVGKGFDELPPVLKQQIDSIIPNGSRIIYSAIQSGLNIDEIENKLFGEYVKPDMQTILDSIVQDKFPIDSDIVVELFGKTGKLHELQTLLDNAKTPEERAKAIESVRNQAKDVVKMYMDNQIISEAENVRNDIATSGDKNQQLNRAMEYLSYTAISREDQWIRSRDSYRDAYAKKVRESMTPGAWMSYIASIASRNRAEWNTFNAREKQVYAGIIRALGFTDDISAEYLSLVTDYQSNWNNFYKYQQQKINEYYGGNITWEDYLADTDRAYDEHFQSEMLIQEKLNESFLRGYSASGFDVAPIRELQNRIVTIRHEMHDMQVDIRQRTRAATKNMERADADKIRNEMYLAFEPEYNGKIEEIANLQSQIGAEIGKDPVEKAREQSGRPIESVPPQEPMSELDKVAQKLKAKVILQDADVIRSNANTDFENAIHETEADRQAKAERPEYYTRDKIRQAFVDSGIPEEKVNLYMELFDAREKQWNKDNPGKDMYKEALRVINITKDEIQGDPLLSQVEVLSPADINTDKFRNWFGDSKVVDADGKPLVVYHGSPNKFEEFSYKHLGTNGTSEGYGFYFSDSKDIAKGYSRGENNLYESYINITKPLSADRKTLTRNDVKKLILEIDRMDMEGEESEHWFLSNYNDVNEYGTNRVLAEAVNLSYENNNNDIDLVSEIINVSGDVEKVYRALKNSLGYDGIITKWKPNDVRGEVNIYIPFLPEQIKSVNNTGSWDPNNPNMLYQSLNERIKGEFQVIDGDTAIHFLESKDVTTLVHESGHLFRRTLNDKQLGDFAQWAGFKSADEYLDYDNRFWDGKLTEEESKRYSEAEEKFARGWEQYLIEGKAPTPTLTKVFKAFTEWMLDIYKAVKSALTGKDYSGQKEFVFNGKPLDIKAEINGVRLVDIFDSMLATKEARGYTTTANGIIDPTMRYEFQYKIMELSDIKPSHQWSGDKLIDNSMYDKALQPRAREQQQSVMQINNMASELSPDLLLLEYHSLDRGAPIIGDDNNIESGNGRMLALLRAKERYPERWAEYQQALLSEINNYGINPEALSEFRNPVLVRERITDIDRTDFAREANKPVALQMTAQENAVNDSKLISDVALSNLDILDNETIEGAIDARRNAGFVQSFMGRLSENEAAQYYFKNKDGNLVLNEQGRRRIVNALFAKVYGKAGESLLQSFTMSTESNIKLLEAALKDSLPQMAVIEGMIARGMRPPELSIANDITIAGEKLTRLRRNGMNVSDYLNQISLPGLEEELTPAQRMFLQYFSEQRSAKKMRQFIREYANLIRNMPDSGQDALFYLPPVSKEELITRAFEKIGDDNSPMLFQTDWLASAIEQFDAGNPITLEQLKQIATPDYQNTELTPDGKIIPDIDEHTTNEIYAKKINPIMHGEYMIAARVYKDGFPIAYYPYNLRMKEIPYNGKVYDVLGIDIDNADQYLFWDGEQVITVDTKQDLSDLDLSEELPTTPVDQQPNNLTMPTGEAYAELISKYLDPIFDELPERYEKELARNKVSGSFSSLDTDSKVALYKYLHGVKDDLAATKYNAVKYGEMKRDQALLNYNKRYGFDTYLTAISPYQFWYTRSMLNWAKRMIDKPIWFTTYARLKEKEELFARDDIPARLDGRFRINMPYLEDWMGGGLYIDILSQFFPFAQFLNKASDHFKDKNILNNKVESLLKEQMDEGIISSKDYLESVKSKNTPTWNTAYAMISNQNSIDPSLGGLAQQYLSLPFLVDWALKKSKGKDGEIANLPITRTGLSLQTLTKGIPVVETAGKVIGGTMTLPEQALRKLYGLDYNELGAYGDYAIKKQLSQMGNSGEISREEMLDAQRNMSGPAYEEAYRRQRKELMLRTQGAAAIDAMKAFIQGDASITDVLQALFVAPFGGLVYPDDEYQLRQQSAEREQAFADKASGKNPNAVNEFYNKYPAFVGRSASFIDDPEQLNKYVAYQQITNMYYSLPKAEQTAIVDALGPDFYNAIINKETRNYKAVPYEDLLTWEYAIRGDNPNIPASAIIKANAPKIQYFTPEVVQAVDEWDVIKNTKYKNIDAIQNAYYALPKSERKAYLIAHPELQSYWDDKHSFEATHPEYVEYSNIRSSMYDEIMAANCFAEMSDSVMSDLEYTTITGAKLRPASVTKLKYLYEKYADPSFDTFDEFVEKLRRYK